MQQAITEANIKPEDANMEELNFSTFYTQLKAMGSMGPMKNVLGMLGAVDVPKGVAEQSEEKIKKYKSIIDSMTKEERDNGALLSSSSRIRRIAAGQRLH